MKKKSKIHKREKRCSDWKKTKRVWRIADIFFVPNMVRVFSFLVSKEDECDSWGLKRREPNSLALEKEEISWFDFWVMLTLEVILGESIADGYCEHIFKWSISYRRYSRIWWTIWSTFYWNVSISTVLIEEDSQSWKKKIDNRSTKSWIWETV